MATLCDETGNLLRDIPESQLIELAETVRLRSEEAGLFFYPKLNARRLIRLNLRPMIISAEQADYVGRVYLEMERAAKMIFSIRRQDLSVRELLPVEPEIESLMESSLAAGHLHPQTFFGRADSVCDVSAKNWKESLRIVEMNLSGLGACYYAGAADKIIWECLNRTLIDRFPKTGFKPAHEFIDLLIKQAIAHAGLINRSAASVGMISFDSEKLGPDELSKTVGIFKERNYRICACEPPELRQSGEEIVCGNGIVDVVYRDTTVSDLLEGEKTGDDMTGLRAAFLSNQVVSGIAGDLDHKAILELFTSERYRRFFTTEQRDLFRRHVIWTRVVRDVRTDAPDGGDVGLIEYIRANRRTLLLKPNTGYGGKGVLFGPSHSTAEWDLAIAEALAEPSSCVVQVFVPPPVVLCPVAREGRISWEEYKYVLAFSASQFGVTFLNRFSKSGAVNISGDAGIMGTMIADRG
ncbi:MAG: hypothetical protein RDV41_06700 [Planctomycetota bacterium]|nr:hypothetical protein [Planctomycetota bacterium]